MPVNSNRKPRSRKTAPKHPTPPKPYDNFPLYAHSAGQWAKKIRGKFYYFGKWAENHKGALKQLPYEASWQAALALYEAEADDLHAGRKVRARNKDGLSLKDLCNQFLLAKHRKIKSGELSQRSFQEYRQTAERLAAMLGKDRLVDDLDAEDFEKLRDTIANRCGPVRLGNEVGRIKSVFKYAVDNGLIVSAVRFGSEFRKPSKKVMRRHRADSGKKLFTAEEVLTILAALEGKPVKVEAKTGKSVKVELESNPQLRAVVLLGINCGAGNTDVANLQAKHLDLANGWLNYARGKTGIDRRVPLWPETIAALKVTIAKRPEPASADDKDCVFLTPRRNGSVRGGGTRLVSVGESSRTDYVCRDFGALLRTLKINGRKMLGYYSLRHTFATNGLQTGDRDAVKSLMGHAEGDMLSLYDETGPSDDRLRAVTNHVRTWLFREGGAK